jgi:hypothetical protein
MFIGIITIAVQQEYPSTHAKHLNNPSKLKETRKNTQPCPTPPTTLK